MRDRAEKPWTEAETSLGSSEFGMSVFGLENLALNPVLTLGFFTKNDKNSFWGAFNIQKMVPLVKKRISHLRDGLRSEPNVCKRFITGWRGYGHFLTEKRKASVEEKERQETLDRYEMIWAICPA